MECTGNPNDISVTCECTENSDEVSVICECTENPDEVSVICERTGNRNEMSILRGFANIDMYGNKTCACRIRACPALERLREEVPVWRRLQR